MSRGCGNLIAWRPFASSWLKARFSSLNFSIIVSKNCSCYYPLLVRVSLIITVCWRRSGSEIVGVRIFTIVVDPRIMHTCVRSESIRSGDIQEMKCLLHDKPVLNQCWICRGASPFKVFDDCVCEPCVAVSQNSSVFSSMSPFLPVLHYRVYGDFSKNLFFLLIPYIFFVCCNFLVTMDPGAPSKKMKWTVNMKTTGKLSIRVAMCMFLITLKMPMHILMSKSKRLGMIRIM